MQCDEDFGRCQRRQVSSNDRYLCDHSVCLITQTLQHYRYSKTGRKLEQSCELPYILYNWVHNSSMWLLSSLLCLPAHSIFPVCHVVFADQFSILLSFSILSGWWSQKNKCCGMESKPQDEQCNNISTQSRR